MKSHELMDIVYKVLRKEGIKIVEIENNERFNELAD